MGVDSTNRVIDSIEEPMSCWRHLTNWPMSTPSAPCASPTYTLTPCGQLPAAKTRPITPPAPTYQDIIKEAKRKFARNQKDFRIEKHRINEEIKFLRQRQERIDKELDRLQAKATKKPYEAGDDFEKFLHNLPFEDQEREFLASLSSSTSEDYNFEDEY
uniref:Family with sequence similarity 227 member B n=1 Tax=Rousettus aegyptiacus TaxID=9407 RepID=A0A7J8IJ90_ROUAE|nr:family with sequence similarity 227 member B [Rousettus aegyptiacus]